MERKKNNFKVKKSNKRKDKYAGWQGCMKQDCIRNYDGNGVKSVTVLQARGWC